MDGKTVAACLDLLADLFLVRRLAPCHGNTRKRLVESPQVPDAHPPEFDPDEPF